jgi:TolA-binding protein
MKASRVAVAVGDAKRGVTLLEKEMQAYPKAPRTEQALFMLAFTLENHVKDLAKAQTVYKNFVAQYPNSDLVDDAKAALALLGQSPEDIIKGFENSNKKIQ